MMHDTSMKVLFITQFSEIGGTSRLHALQFVPHLEREYGMRIDVRHVYTDDFFRMQMGLTRAGTARKVAGLLAGLIRGMSKKVWFIFIAARYDVVFIQRETLPVALYWLLRVRNPRVVYQLEDAIYEISPFLKQSFFHALLLRYQAHLCRAMMRGAARVIAENEGIAEEARKYNGRVLIISAPIDSERFAPAPQAPDDASGSVTIGWIGSPATAHILKTMDGVWRALARAYGGSVRLKVVGAGRDYAAPEMTLINKDWSFDTEVADLQSFDIGVMPVENAEFQKGRLGGKMIFYMMVGIPFVAGRGSLNEAAAEDGAQGFFAATNEEWVEKLSLLIDDAALRARMGRAGRIRAEKQFSLASKIPVFAGVLKQTAAL